MAATTATKNITPDPKPMTKGQQAKAAREAAAKAEAEQAVLDASPSQVTPDNLDDLAGSTSPSDVEAAVKAAEKSDKKPKKIDEAKVIDLFSVRGFTIAEIARVVLCSQGDVRDILNEAEVDISADKNALPVVRGERKAREKAVPKTNLQRLEALTVKYSDPKYLKGSCWSQIDALLKQDPDVANYLGSLNELQANDIHAYGVALTALAAWLSSMSRTKKTK